MQAAIYQMLMIEITREYMGFLNKFLVCKEIQSIHANYLITELLTFNGT